MGRAGSGRCPHSESRTTVGQCRTIDINALNREGLLEPDTSGTTTWFTGGTKVASIGHIRTTTPSGEAALRLSYTVTNRGSEDRAIDYHVPLTYTECNFGGTRPWFVCPGAKCSERVGKLYWPPAADRFFCRHCHDLGYESSQKSGTAFYENVTKPLRAANAARAALSDGPLDSERLEACYEARKALDEGITREFDAKGTTPRPTTPSTFEEWRDRLFKRIGITRGYGAYGRCEATAKTTSERCRQAAIGHHDKCYYHGGAPGSGIGENQRDRAQERIDAFVTRCEAEQREDASRVNYSLAARDGNSVGHTRERGDLPTG